MPLMLCHPAPIKSSDGTTPQVARSTGHMTAASDSLPRTPNLQLVAGGRGTQVVGANRAVVARDAGSFSVSPSANPAGRRKRNTVELPAGLGPLLRHNVGSGPSRRGFRAGAHA